MHRQNAQGSKVLVKGRVHNARAPLQQGEALAQNRLKFANVNSDVAVRTSGLVLARPEGGNSMSRIWARYGGVVREGIGAVSSIVVVGEVMDIVCAACSQESLVVPMSRVCFARARVCISRPRTGYLA